MTQHINNNAHAIDKQRSDLIYIFAMKSGKRKPILLHVSKSKSESHGQSMKVIHIITIKSASHGFTYLTNKEWNICHLI
jgi:hypothetical protein